MPNKKRVKFNSIVNAVLIPSSNDYKLFHLTKDLWWEKQDYINFRISANKKRVKFNSIVNAVLIPSSNDYKLFHLTKDLWWEKEDYINFRISADNDINELMLKHHGLMDYKEAQQILFQPFRYDITNFL
jgi:hypothetical protein